MKRFIFCEAQEGGMDHYVVEIPEGEEFTYEWPICGWMSGTCEYEDNRLALFAKTATVGDFHEHRMGVAVRLRDK